MQNYQNKNEIYLKNSQNAKLNLKKAWPLEMNRVEYSCLNKECSALKIGEQV